MKAAYVYYVKYAINSAWPPKSLNFYTCLQQAFVLNFLKKSKLAPARATSNTGKPEIKVILDGNWNTCMRGLPSGVDDFALSICPCFISN